MAWSPQDAMKAYLQTLHMCKVNDMHDDEVQKCGIGGNKVIEPQGIELLSALAAGNQARTILDITTSEQQGVTPLTLALAVAAKQTEGKLICIRPNLDSLYELPQELDHDHNQHHEICDTSDVTELRVGDPCEVINDIRDVEFAVIDCAECDSSRLRLLSEKLHLSPRGATIVANNILHKEQGVALVDKLVKSKEGVESSVTTLPLGSSSGFQLIIKIKALMVKSPTSRRKHKRFFVTFDE